jgi:hypothetical protein
LYTDYKEDSLLTGKLKSLIVRDMIISTGMRDHNIGAYRCRTFFHPEVGRRLRGERFPKLVRVFRKQRGKRSLVRATCGGQLREQVDCVEELAGAGVPLEGWPPLDGGGRLRERE